MQRCNTRFFFSSVRSFRNHFVGVNGLFLKLKLELNSLFLWRKLQTENWKSFFIVLTKTKSILYYRRLFLISTRSCRRFFYIDSKIISKTSRYLSNVIFIFLQCHNYYSMINIKYFNFWENKIRGVGGGGEGGEEREWEREAEGGCAIILFIHILYIFYDLKWIV